MSEFPYIDATQQDCITDEQAQFFLANGLLILRQVLRGDELRALQEQTAVLVQQAVDEGPQEDYHYKRHALTGQDVPYYVDYIVDKTTANKALLGHPFILRTVEKLQGPTFIPTWDSMVFKLPGAGASIPWHRDAGMAQVMGDRPIFNVGFYLDESDLSNCLWGIRGSHHWPDEQATRACRTLNAHDQFQITEAVPLPMQPGDVIIHNILVLHGSPAAQSHLRRVIYYEFRPAEVELAIGPHTPEYIPLKQQVLLACLRDRAAAPYAQGEPGFVYTPSAEFAPPPLAAAEALPTYRYPHAQYERY